MSNMCKKCSTVFEGESCPTCGLLADESQTSPDEVSKKKVQQGNDEISEAEPPKHQKPKKKRVRMILEIVGGVLLLSSLAATSGNVPKSQYEKLDEAYQEQSKLLDTAETDLISMKKEYNSYKTKMKPYEELEVPI